MAVFKEANFCTIRIYLSVWRSGKEPNIKIPGLNKMIKEYPKEANVTYVIYFTPMVNNKNGIKQELPEDGAHPISAAVIR